MKDKSSLKLGRRGFAGFLATATGGLLIRSLVTGIPAKVLTDPLAASADDMAKGKLLVVFGSTLGDPVNANCPGTYEFADIVHPDTPDFAPTAIKFGATTVKAAKCWASLLNDPTRNLKARTAFFHHTTDTPVHGEYGTVLKLRSNTEDDDMLVSLIGRELGGALGTKQLDPLSVGASGGELLSANGRVLANVAPTSIQRALAGIGDAKLVTLRDKSVDKMYALYKERGTESQRKLLDAWAISRDQVRSISEALINDLSAITGNGQSDQVTAVSVLAALGIAPAITLHLDFGSDNHSDKDLQDEADGHVASLADLGSLMDKLDAYQATGALKHEVVVASLNVFGRTLKSKGTTGRDHNKDHHVMVITGTKGAGIQGGVIGGVVATSKDYAAAAIDSKTGLASPSGDISGLDTLRSAGRTLAYACGVSDARLDTMVIGDGPAIKSILA